MDIIDLCTSDEEENTPVQQVTGGKRKALPCAAAKHEAEAKAPRVAEDVDSDVEEVEAPPGNSSFSAAGASSSVAGASSSAGSASSSDNAALDDNADADDEVAIIGRSGALALEDFPHARFNCMAVKFTAGQEYRRCANCYCYCCDKPASECKEWKMHCKATHGDPKWKALRESIAAGANSHAGAGRSSALPTAAASASSSAGAPASGAGRASSESWSCERLLRELRQVYPEEEPEPAGLLKSVRLKPYQKQCLAFMLNQERSTDASLEGRHYNLGIIQEVGMGKTAVAISLILSNPPQGGARPTASEAAMITSGWKTAAESRKMPLPVWPVTYILTPMTLLGQWSDEIRKFAPKLKVAVIHSSGKAHPADIAAADVILCTPQSNHGPMQRRPLHRLIIDESHTIKLGTSIQRQVMDIWAHNVWLLTGTPVSTSVADLHAGAQILGQATSGVRLFEPYPSANAAFLTKLKKLCIRHTKTMRIGGEVALALPDSDVSTVWLTMSPLERRLYDKAVAHESMAIHKLSSGGASFTIEVALSRRRAACSNSYTKYRSGASKMDPSRSIYDSVSSSYTKADVESICNWTDIAPVHRMPHRPPADPTLHREYTADPAKCTKLAALRSDLLALRAKDASMHAVVFTHIMATHVSIVSMLRSSGFHVCEVSGTTVADKRHETIRDFQASGAARKKVAKVFVITMRTGAVGITLTAATRVYLMEPSFDPAMEVQAAGRIHRLGQDKDVLVKRFAFRDSLEANICTLHEAMKKPNSKVGVTDGVLPAAAVRVLLGSANGKANAA